MSQASRKDRLSTRAVPGLLPEGGTEQSNARPSQRSARLEVANASIATGPPKECAQRASCFSGSCRAMASATSAACVDSFILFSTQGEPAVPRRLMECAAMPCFSARRGSHFSAKHHAPWNVPWTQTRCVFGEGGSQESHCMRWPDVRATSVVLTLSASVTVAVARTRAASRRMVAVRSALFSLLYGSPGVLGAAARTAVKQYQCMRAIRACKAQSCKI